jgi:hypothetical protein
MYRSINDALNGVLLSGRFESRPLYLVLDKRGRDDLAASLGLDLEGEEIDDHCCRVVGTSLPSAGDPYDGLLSQAFSWRASGRKTPPPFTAALFTLSRAAELMVSDAQFSASNYYQRLAELTGVDRQRLSFHGSSTEKLWRSFNNWLADTDFQYGRPTARALNSLRYVGIAMSQAIVREEDRRRFHDLFVKYGFQPTDAVTAEAMSPYVETWIHGSKPTRQLKGAWAKVDLRPRICEAAVAELEEWKTDEHAGSATVDGQSVRLSLAAGFRHELLGRSFALYLGREVEMDPEELARGDGTTRFTIGNATFGNLATVEPRAAIDWVNVLSRGFRGLRAGSKGELYWSARSVIPMARSPRGDYWVEASRISLGDEHLVLARADAKVRDSVERALEQVAAPGYTLSTPHSVKGVPQGWVAYEGVRIIASLAHPDGFQMPLAALTGTSSFQVIGGLKMGQSIWHKYRPPTAFLDADGSITTLRAWEGTSSEGIELCSETDNRGHATLELGACEATSGNLYIEGSADEASAGSASVLLRSAARPRPLDRLGRKELGYVGSLSAALVDTGIAVVRGLDAPDEPPSNQLVKLTDFRDLGSRGEAEDAASAGGEPIAQSPAFSLAGLSELEVRTLSCAVRGFHRFKYETLPPKFPKYAPVNKECQECRVHVLERRGQAKPARVPSVSKGKIPLTPKVREEPMKGASIDLWLDAACFWGHGSRATFEALLSADDIDPWKAGQVLRDLAWLGHLDVAMTSQARLGSWSVSPPVLSFTPTGTAFLAGFRNQPMLDSLNVVVDQAGGRCSFTSLPGQPGLVEIHGLGVEQAREVLTGFADCHGRSLKVMSDSPAYIARFSNARDSLSSNFRPITLDARADVERFDLDRFRWRRSESSHEPGAYRFLYAGTQYAFRARSGQAYAGSHELVKLAAARLEGIKLHSYDEQQRVISSVLGCEPPGLLGRALVASSGRLPTVADGVSSFPGISTATAAHVLTYLYSGDLPA